jgi:hypothetical protein
VDLKDFKSSVGCLEHPRWVRFPHIPGAIGVRRQGLRLEIVLLFSMVALLLCASSLLADDGTPKLDGPSAPDTSSATPGSLIGVTPSFSLEEEPQLRHSPGRSVLYSAALPGLGQAHNGRWVKASSFVVVGSLLVSKIFVESQRADRYLHLSRNALTIEESEAFYDDYSRHFDARDRLIWWAVGFWVFNMLDAYIDGHLFGFSRQ